MEFQKIQQLMDFKNSDHFTIKEKTLLIYLEEVTLMKNCTDETFLNLKNFFSDKEIVEITWLCATENYFNLLAKPLGIESDELAKRRKV